MTNILILGAGGPAGVNFIKSLRLSENRYSITATDCNLYHIQFIEPFVDKTYLIHKVYHEQYMNDIETIIKKNKVDVLYIQSDIEVGFWGDCNRRKLFDNYKIKYLLPSDDVVRKCQAKDISASMWNSIKPFKFTLNPPKSQIEEAFSFCESDKIWIRATHGAGGKASMLADSIEKAYHWIHFWQNHEPDVQLIAQKYVHGKNIAWQSVWYKGKLITSQARERIEYIYPHLSPSGITGTPIVAKTISDNSVNSSAVSAIKTIDPEPHGVYCVDMIQEDKINYITEINVGRFFTTSYFFSKAGYEFNIPYANMPELLIFLALDQLDFYITTNGLENIELANILPNELYWIRHIDIPARLLTKKEVFSFL